MKRLLKPSLILLGILFFLAMLLYDVLKAGSTPVLNFINSDMYSQFWPVLTLSREYVRAGALPLWNPYDALGGPLFAINGQSLLSPINWVMLLLDVPRAMLVIQFLNTIIGMVGTLLYMRYLKLDWPAVILGTMLFGYAVFLDTFVPNKGATLCWLPLIILLTHRLFDRPSFGACIALTASLVLCFLGGFANYFYYICIIGFVYFSFVIVFSWSEYKLKGTLLRLSLVGLAFVLMLGIVSVQFLPMVELSLSSVRNITKEYVSTGHDPYDVFSISLVFNNYLNSRGAHIWGDRNLFVSAAIYYYGSSLLFVPFSIASKKDRPVVIALFATIGYTVLFVLSKHVPSLAIFGKLPFSDSLRWHARMIDMNQFALGVLAGIGLLVLWEKGSVRLRDTETGKLNWFPILAVLYTLFVAYPTCKTVPRLLFRSSGYFVILLPWIVIGAAFLIRASRYSFRVKTVLMGMVLLTSLLGAVHLWDVLDAVIDLIILLLCVSLILFVFICALDGVPRMKRFILGMTVGLAVLGIVFGHRFEPTGCFVLFMTAVFVFYFFYDSGLPSWPKKTGVWVLALLILVEIVSYRHIRSTVPATTVKSYAGSSDVSWRKWITEHAGYDRVYLKYAVNSPEKSRGSGDRIFNISSYTSFTLARWGDFVEFMIGDKEFEEIVTFYGLFVGFEKDLPQRAKEMGLASLRYMVTDSEMSEEDSRDSWKLRYQNSTEPEICIYENEFALPRTYLVNNYIITHGEQESLQAIRNNLSELSHSVILENGQPSFASSDASTRSGRARIDRYENDEVELHVEADKPSLVILTDGYYPGWNAFVDGVRTPIWRANSLFRAVETPAGNHTVVFKYQPASLRWGAAISLGTLLLILCSFSFVVLRKRSKR